VEIIKATIRFEPEGRKTLAECGVTISEAAKQAGIGIRSECGGENSCGKCRVVIESQLKLNGVSGNERKHITPAELSQGYRLACCTIAHGNATVYVPPESRVGIRRIQVEGLIRPIKLDPAIKKFHLILPKPTIYDVSPDFERLVTSIQKKEYIKPEIEYELLKTLSTIFREANWDITATAWNSEKIISIEKGNTEDEIYGFSVDIGTSKIVGYLVDLISGNVVNVQSLENPQIMHGEDVLSRINYTVDCEEGLKKLQTILIEAINNLISKASQESAVDPDRIYEITIVGNTAMHHIFLGITPKYLMIAPYVPSIKRAVDVKANSVRIMASPYANVHVLPVIAGFVGADGVADVLASGIYEMSNVCLLVDMGTNGEVFVGNQEDIVSCSCAAGPAFEGMHIKYGMKASTGAIEKLKIIPDTYDVEYETIDGTEPTGICGSGIIDAVAELFKNRVINERGGFNKNIQTSRLRYSNEAEFVIAWKDETKLESDITISRKDIQEIQLAKAAIHTGAVALMWKKNLTDHDLDQVYIAGGFGRYINVESARLIGLIPDVPTEKISFIGNTAISGAKMALISRETRETAQRLSTKIRYVELMADPNFRREFLDSIFLPHRNIMRYPTVARNFENTNSGLKAEKNKDYSQYSEKAQI
jgi:uncharacterized 2Fe-2S/4Fe-4S cluster protein (DUF4445 family)